MRADFRAFCVDALRQQQQLIRIPADVAVETMFENNYPDKRDVDPAAG